MTAPPFDVQKAHRWFAIELNNAAWDAIEASKRSEDETERMIHAAHASYHHWLQAGEPINRLRAECLVATAYLKAGLAEAALRHARRCLAQSEQLGEAPTRFDRASVLAAAACAFALAGRDETANELAKQADRELQSLESAEDRALLARLYPVA